MLYSLHGVFGGILMSDFAVHGIGFFGPWFSNFGIGIRVSELVETLYCIVNTLYNAMKKTKRASEALRKLVFPFRVSRVNLCVFVCECHCGISDFA